MSYRTTPAMDQDYDYDATPTNASAAGLDQNHFYGSKKYERDNNMAEDALMDLAQLEELHSEAEHMKILGNKHMANQEYKQAYNAYSAALQLSPVGPSSHVFLSNRAAALLSLKQYQQAATDAKRAVALAPTFGKAHARLGQALYFLKNYQAAIEAYQDAIHYEPENEVTQTYLDKAVSKLERQKSRAAGTAESVYGESVWQDNYSVATDPKAQHTLVGRGQPRAAVMAAADHSDPEFEEAVKIQQRANNYLIQKKYKQAIEEYTAALFLVPDDANLSPDLHLGRAHALNGSRRHESAKNDAILALKLQATPAAYSTLAKSLFYLKDYQGAIDAFQDCQELLDGEPLGTFDQAYLQKAKQALQDAQASLDMEDRSTTRSVSSNIPKLKPPRFVPREEALVRPPPVRSMPKTWPQQHNTTVQVGPERRVVCVSEALGVKLNRGSDGFVRVLSVSDNGIRQGDIFPGDIIREAAGVDIRRPITNIMWGDTVALIKMAPRPITLTVAEELNATAPSRSSTEDAVADDIASVEDDVASVEDNVASVKEKESPESLAEPPTLVRTSSTEEAETSQEIIDNDNLAENTGPDKLEAPPKSGDCTNGVVAEEEEDDDDGIESIEDEDSQHSAPIKLPMPTPESEQDETPHEISQGSLRGEEERIVGGEILFLRETPTSYCGWDQLRWMAHNGVRKVNLCQPVYRVSDTKKKGLPMFWKTGSKNYEERSLILYDEPNLILVVRRPSSLEEIRKLLGIEEEDLGPEGDWAINPETAMQSYWVLESVADPTTSKLRLSPLTAATSVAVEGDGDRERSCFQILTPTETISLSAVDVRNGLKRAERSFSDSGAFLETLSVESSISDVICQAHSHAGDLGNTKTDIAWKHQVIIGSLHSLVLSGKVPDLERGIKQARKRIANTGGGDAGVSPQYLPSRIIDAADDNGYPALYYACSHRMSPAVRCLVNAGADTNFLIEVHGLSMTHVAARNLDETTLSTLLSATFPARPNPNALDKKGRTPMYMAAVEGSVLDNGKDPSSLARCISVLSAWGGTIVAPDSPAELRHPVSALAYMWLPAYLSVVLDFVPHTFPLTVDAKLQLSSLSAFYQYPIHVAILAFRKQIRKGKAGNGPSVVQTLRALIEYGFEPNERLDSRAFGAERTTLDDFIGYAPIQMIALMALELEASKEDMDSAVYIENVKVIREVAELLVSRGARLSLEPPASDRLRSIESPTSSEAQARRVELLTAKLEADKQIMELLGGNNLLKGARKVWLALDKVHAGPSQAFEDDTSTPADTVVAGGSDSASCAICWSAFGTLMNRKHKCRVSNRYVCDECSTKRVTDGQGSDHRVSDGQFLATKFGVRRQQNKIIAEKKEEAALSNQKTAQAREALRQKRIETEEKSNKETLFGGIVEAATAASNAATSFVLGDDVEQDTETITAQLDKTRDALNQRGEKLSSINDKSAKLKDASADFAKMAKELKEQSEGGLFW